MEQENNTWVLIEKYLPDYYSNKKITILSDLQKIIDKEYEEGDDAYTRVQEVYAGDDESPDIEEDYKYYYIEVLEETIRVMNSIIEKE